MTLAAHIVLPAGVGTFLAVSSRMVPLAEEMPVRWTYAEIPSVQPSGKANEINGRIWAPSSMPETTDYGMAFDYLPPVTDRGGSV